MISETMPVNPCYNKIISYFQKIVMEEQIMTVSI